MSDNSRAYWDGQAAEFDLEPDHGLRDPDTRRAWRELLLAYLPPPPAEVVDLGCGTGSISVLLAEAGYRVRGVDLSSVMITKAQAKASAAGVEVAFEQGDAGDPPYRPGSADVVLSRHVLWALSNPADVVGRWVSLLRPTGRLLLVEGRWFTGGGLTAAECEALVRKHRRSVEVRLLGQAKYWGRSIDDERYLLLSTD